MKGRKLKCIVCGRQKRVEGEGRIIDGTWVGDENIRRKYWNRWVCSYKCYSVLEKNEFYKKKGGKMEDKNNNISDELEGIFKKAFRCPSIATWLRLKKEHSLIIPLVEFLEEAKEEGEISESEYEEILKKIEAEKEAVEEWFEKIMKSMRGKKDDKGMEK
jgi:hypothetical protein